MKTQGKNKDVVFLSGVRTGYGDFGGTLKNLSATQLGTIASTHAVERSGVDAGDFDHVVFGNAQQTSADAIYLARHVGLQSGLPVETPALQGRAPFEAGQRRTEAEVVAVAEGEVAVVAAPQVQALGLGELLGIPVRRGQHDI